jgi:hypothetical protein
MSYGTVQAEKMTTESGYSLGAGNASSFKNRLINGNMATAQRDSGAVANLVSSSTLTYNTLDRWGYWAQDSSKFTVTQSSTAPTGFSTSALITSSTALSVGAGAYYAFAQRIEGYNFADFNFGSANAKSFTVSFWIYSSVTGTFPFYCFNSGYSRSYASTFTVNAANTWEQKTITVAGDTSGTWIGATNGIGIEVGITLAAGSSWFSPSANTWSSTSFGLGLSGATNFLETNGATMYVTGFQLEAGTVATSFDFRSYGTELALCQRYYWQLSSSDKGGYVNAIIYQGWADSATSSIGIVQFPVTMRTSPTVSTSGTVADYVFRVPLSQGTTAVCDAVPTLGTSGTNYNRIGATTSGTFTVGAGHYFSFSGNTTGYVGFSAEL